LPAGTAGSASGPSAIRKRVASGAIAGRGIGNLRQLGSDSSSRLHPTGSTDAAISSSLSRNAG
jgi:hypothetical protein